MDNEDLRQVKGHERGRIFQKMIVGQ